MSGAYGGGKRLQARTWKDKEGVRLFVIQGLKPGEYVLETGEHDVNRMFELDSKQTAELIKFLSSR